MVIHFALAFLIIRLYAIFDRSLWILYTTIPFALLNIILSSVSLLFGLWFPAAS